MSEPEIVSERDYLYLAAGRKWLVPELHLTKLPDGTLALSMAEIRRVHRAVANELCGMSEDLNGVELEFLCDVTGSSFTEVARHLGVHKSTVTKWRAADSLPHLASLPLKRWFWFRIFGEELTDWRVPLAELTDEQEFLSRARDVAVSRRVVEPLSMRAA